jgi:hypothetical protein
MMELKNKTVSVSELSASSMADNAPASFYNPLTVPESNLSSPTRSAVEWFFLPETPIRAIILLC